MGATGMRNGKHAPAGVPGDGARQLRLGDGTRAGHDERLARRRRDAPSAQLVPVEQVVDVDEMVVRPARAHDRVAAARDGAEELQEARLARAVDGARTHHDHGQPALAVEAQGQGLGLRLRLLVDVAGRRTGPSRRREDARTSPCTPTVEVWTNRRTPARAAASSRRSVPPDVDVAVVGVGMPRRPIHGGHVDDRVRALHQAGQGVRGRRGRPRPTPPRGRRPPRRARPGQGGDLVAAGAQPLDEPAAGVPRPARDRDAQAGSLTCGCASGG